MADNAETVSEDGKFISIAEMAIDILLFCVRTGSSLRRHETVSHLIRVKIGIVFIVSLEVVDKGIEGLGIVFGEIKFNARGIESKHGGKGSVDCLADGVGIIHHPMEDECNVIRETDLKA